MMETDTSLITLCTGTRPKKDTEAQMLADRELLTAIRQCESFVDKWEDPIKLLRIVKHQLKFIFHEIGDQSVVYTVFEVLNNRGLRVSWLDRLKSRLMSVAFEGNQGNSPEHYTRTSKYLGRYL